MVQDLEELTPLYSYMKNPSLIDFPDEMAVIFFVSVCNFRCRFCHNRSLIDKKHNLFSYGYLKDLLKKYKDNWTEAVVISGGEPCCHPKLYNLLKFISDLGFKIKLDTNGSFPDRLQEVLPLVDYVAMDLKASFENYGKLVSFSETDKIKKSIEVLKLSNKPFELRTTILEDFHTKEEVKKMVPILDGVSKYFLQPFIPREEVYDENLRNAPRTSKMYLEELRALLRENGVEAVIR